MQMQQSMRSVTQRGCRVSGTDFIGTVSIQPGGGKQYSILAQFPISVSSFPGTWLTTQATLWERYRFNRFNIRFVPAVATSLACQLVGWIDTDPKDDPTNFGQTEALVRQALSQRGSSAFNIITPTSFSLTPRADRQEYYTGDDKGNSRFTRAGNFYLAQITQAIGFDGKLLVDELICGSLYADWDVSFDVPQIEPPRPQPPPAANTSILTGATDRFELPINAKGQTITIPIATAPKEGWTNLFTAQAEAPVPGKRYACRITLQDDGISEFPSEVFGQAILTHADGFDDQLTKVIYGTGEEGPLGDSIYTTGSDPDLAPTFGDSSGFDAFWNIGIQKAGSNDVIPVAQLHGQERVVAVNDTGGSIGVCMNNGALSYNFYMGIKPPETYTEPTTGPGPGPPLPILDGDNGLLADFIYEVGDVLVIQFLPNRWKKVARALTALALELVELL